MTPPIAAAPRPLVVLASASPARLRLLRDAGISPLVRVSGVDEAAVVAAQAVDDPSLATDPDRVALLLATAKARDVVAMLGRDTPAAVREAGQVAVVGCDSVLHHGAAVLGKPVDADDARRRWRTMRGTEGVLVTGHAVVRLSDGHTAVASASTVVRFADVGDDEIDAYVATGEPLRVAGAFTLDGLGAPFVDGVVGDASNVIGLSLPLLRRLLGDVGLRWTDLWPDPPTDRWTET